MKKLLITAAMAAIAGAPAATGLAGNASFAQSVPVQVPAGARTLDDHGRHAEQRDDHHRHAEGQEDRGQRAEPGDDRGKVSGPGASATRRGRGEDQVPGSVAAGDGGSRHGRHDYGSAVR
jgi:Ni/Co efflux regulator RcnB